MLLVVPAQLARFESAMVGLLLGSGAARLRPGYVPYPMAARAHVPVRTFLWVWGLADALSPVAKPGV